MVSRFSGVYFLSFCLIGLNDVLPGGDLGVSTLLAAAPFYDPEKFCTLPDHVHRCDGSHTTSLRCRGVGRVSFPSDRSIVSRDGGILRGSSDLLVPRC
jgi:hypothetical protein